MVNVSLEEHSDFMRMWAEIGMKEVMRQIGISTKNFLGSKQSKFKGPGVGVLLLLEGQGFREPWGSGQKRHGGMFMFRYEEQG